ncbi:ubiquitin carboxyl-terminal hydrolase [Anaeramoeba flamelloides]|uniref:Ubiquitin carboxyl-terminal hydrolase n=1 Tax=Anaeramoeba flamelloides TaxID=1746091 RepID=A0AAV7Y5Q9_9EUKA|nr:ubiquitin carboxyl-terminal hydrolase [Anaeramoeba flamelloides]
MSNLKKLKALLKKFDFPKPTIKEILKRKPKDLAEALEIEKEIRTQKTQPTSRSKEDQELEKVLQESLQEYIQKQESQFGGGLSLSSSVIFDQDINPYSIRRITGTPVGLRNVGNTCFANSLLQTYANIPLFRQEILLFPLTEKEMQKLERKSRTLKEVVQQMSPIGVHFVQALQRLFGDMLLTNKKCVNPLEIWKALETETFKFGGQEDPTELNNLFIEKIRQGFSSASTILEIAGKEFQGESVITELFTGEVTQTFSLPADNPFNTTNQIKILSQKRERFEQLILPIFNQKKQKETLLSTLERFCNNKVEYILKVKEKNKTKKQKKIVIADQITTFQRLPKFLIIQLQRAVFNPNSLQMSKNDEIFTFEKIIYLDKFVSSNQKDVQVRLQKEQIIKDRISLLQTELLRLQDWKGLGNSLQLILQSTIDFMNEEVEFQFNNNKFNNQFNKYSSGSTTTTTTTTTTSSSSTNSNNSNKIDENYLGEEEFNFNKKNKLGDMKEKDTTQKYLKKKLKIIRQRKKDIQNQITQEQQNLKLLKKNQKLKYHLFSMIVHSGKVSFGHYFNFIYQFTNNTWWKFNDQNVEKIKEEEVIQIASGNKAGTSAYCLVYADAKFLKGMKISNIVDKELVPYELVDMIKKKNLQFEEELNKFDKSNRQQHTKKKLITFQKKFEMQFSHIQSQVTQLEKQKFQDPALISIIHYSITRNELNVARTLLLNDWIENNVDDELNNQIFLKQVKKKLGISLTSEFHIKSTLIEYEVYKRLTRKFLFSLKSILENQIELGLKQLIATYQEWFRSRRNTNIILNNITIIIISLFDDLKEKLSKRSILGNNKMNVENNNSQIEKDLDFLKKILNLAMFSFGHKTAILKILVQHWKGIEHLKKNNSKSIILKIQKISLILNGDIENQNGSLKSVILTSKNNTDLLKEYFSILKVFQKKYSKFYIDDIFSKK